MPDSNEQPNPYQQGRDHESLSPMDRDDMLAVAGLLGTVNGALGEIDKKNVGGSNQFVQARKMDPKQALQNIASAHGAVINTPASPSAPQHNTSPPPVHPSNAPPVRNTSPPLHNNESVLDLEKRIRSLESIVESYKKIEKFKRGVGYSINTTKIKGQFKDPITILDIISTEISKNTKTITLKLINATPEPKKQE